jgi:hypothetical protein
MEEDFLLTFELSKNNDELYIYSDLNGLKSLIDELNKLLKSAEEGKNDHTHLMTEEWGGYELSSDNQSGEVINHVKIYCLVDK